MLQSKLQWSEESNSHDIEFSEDTANFSEGRVNIFKIEETISQRIKKRSTSEDLAEAEVVIFYSY